jgi:hypothetical protein
MLTFGRRFNSDADVVQTGETCHRLGWLAPVVEMPTRVRCPDPPQRTELLRQRVDAMAADYREQVGIDRLTYDATVPNGGLA